MNMLRETPFSRLRPRSCEKQVLKRTTTKEMSSYIAGIASKSFRLILPLPGNFLRLAPSSFGEVMAVLFHSAERNSATVLRKTSMKQRPGSSDTRPIEEPEESWDVGNFAASQEARARRPGPERES